MLHSRREASIASEEEDEEDAGRWRLAEDMLTSHSRDCGQISQNDVGTAGAKKIEFSSFLVLIWHGLHAHIFLEKKRITEMRGHVKHRELKKSAAGVPLLNFNLQYVKLIFVKHAWKYLDSHTYILNTTN
jgi:hypothetical protein